jgi:hypothetical protein
MMAGRESVVHVLLPRICTIEKPQHDGDRDAIDRAAWPAKVLVKLSGSVNWVSRAIAAVDGQHAATNNKQTQ